MAKFSRLLLTGASGALGTELRKSLAHLCDVMRVTNRHELGNIADHEEGIVCDLSDKEQAYELTKDVDVVVHMGGVGKENTFDAILQSNYIGFYNLYEGCRKNGVKRIVWGSSNHAIGFYPRTQTIDASATPKPDSLYGVSKVYGEALAQYYFDKFSLESVSIRIGSSFPEPLDRRMLATWLSYRDLTQLVERSLIVPKVGHMIVYGMSDNDETFWDNTQASSLGYRPKDNAEMYREKVESNTPLPDPCDPTFMYHGGGFAKAGHFED